jgi:indole-3-glycerol phosphate synthase/phosphoribosylanthranilate isomerase
MNILREIVEKRKALVGERGPALGYPVPEKRTVPLVPFTTQPLLICEIKRSSPSKGDISIGLEAVRQAALYEGKGVRSVSVLTEESYFKGSLADLVNVKKRFPHLSILRKDFLLTREDIDVSYRSGADAVLLIASVLGDSEFEDLHAYATSLGLAALVEVHGSDDIAKVRKIRPPLTGINCRDLETFRIDITYPFTVKQLIDWKTEIVFESGIGAEEHARIALGGGFAGLLVGEAVVRRPELIGELLAAFALPRRDFWSKLYARRKPFVKICGITNVEDARTAAAAGADVIGFIFAESKRRADFRLPMELAELDVLKAGVVVTDETNGVLPADVKALLDDGFIDAVQLHGNEQPDTCYSIGFPYYKTARPRSTAETDSVLSFACPRILVDVYSEKAAGGTGELVSREIIESLSAKRPLWIAGGMSPETVGPIMERFSPELVDAASKLESSPGKKDSTLVELFICSVKTSRTGN